MSFNTIDCYKRLYLIPCHVTAGFPGGSVVQNLPATAGAAGDSGSIWVGKIPRSREWQSTPVFLPEESHGQRSLVGYSPWDHKESDMTE